MAFRTNKTPVLQEKSASGAVASFNTALAMPLVKCEANFSATQEGTPTPVNPILINGITTLDVVVNSSTISKSLGNTYYGGTLDLISGLLKLTYFHFVADSSIITKIFDHGSQTSMFRIIYADNNFPVASNNNTILSSHFSRNNTGSGSASNGNTLIFCSIANSLISPENDIGFQAWLAANSVEFAYEMATPIEIQLTPTQIETIIGNNTIFADTGDVDLTYKDLDIAKRGNFREVFKLPS